MAYLGRAKPQETTSSVLRSTYTGNGSTTTYALPGPVANETSIIATINGVTQQDAAYSTDGSNIIFDAAPASGDSIEIRTFSAVAMSYAPMAGSVVTGILADGAVTTDKINNASVTGAKLAAGAAVANISGRSITAAQMPAGTVLQVVSDKNTNNFSTTSQNVYVTTSQTLSITPTSTTSKILVIFSAGSVTTTAANTGGGVQVRRSGTVIAESGFYQAAVGGNISPPFGSQIALDSPNTTSTITYEVFAQETGVPGTFGLNQPRNLTLMEIAA
jgi:hypothetical protein